MPWGVASAVSFSAVEDARYKFLALPLGGSQVAWGVSLDVPAQLDQPRRRSGFISAFVSVGDRELFGPSEALFYGVEGRPVGIHLLDYRWIQMYPGLASMITAYGVAVCPERGAYPATATLWGLT